MGERLGFNRLIHSDWSIHQNKRWSSIATWRKPRWRIECLIRTPPKLEFLELLLQDEHCTLAGFDFAIGLPQAYLKSVELSFINLLLSIGSAPWHEFNIVAEEPAHVSRHRPFYPNRAARGLSQKVIVEALGVTNMRMLMRDCEKDTRFRSAASSIFWTLGPKQVGKAALAGWREVVAPAIFREAKLWPYCGPLSSVGRTALTIAETYPAEAYQHIGLPRLIRKRTQSGRLAAGTRILEWLEGRNVEISDIIKDQVAVGFGSSPEGEDPFDALVGLISMIEVAEGRRPESSIHNLGTQNREGWILGQIDLPIDYAAATE